MPYTRYMTDNDLTLPFDEPEKPVEKLMTVTEVNRLARHKLETITVKVQGEVSRLNSNYPYYVYFDLRDSEAALPAVVPRRVYDALGFPLKEGDAIVVEGMLSLFERQGRYQVKVTTMRPFGEGELQQRIEALKRKLQAEGLFDEARKKPLPLFPERIGLVTSTRGAAIRDVIVTIRRRFPPARVFVRGVTVQGTPAPAEITAGLRLFDEKWPVDLVILARGGGSLQDLEPFSTEAVARAVAAMKTPVITGIGHEPDVSIADLVADRRASTPTGAAEAAVPDRAEVGTRLAKSAAALSRHTGSELRNSRSTLNGIGSRPLYRRRETLLAAMMQRWERAASALPGSPVRGLQRARHRIDSLAARPVFSGAASLLMARSALLSASKEAAARAAKRFIELRRSGLDRTLASLEAMSPLAVLERGYSITFDGKTGRAVRKADEVKEEDSLRILLHEGELRAKVTGKEPESGG